MIGVVCFAERASYVLRFIDRIEALRDELAMVIHEETGKPFWESKTEIATMTLAAVSKKPMKSVLVSVMRNQRRSICFDPPAHWRVYRPGSI